MGIQDIVNGYFVKANEYTDEIRDIIKEVKGKTKKEEKQNLKSKADGKTKLY
jgi:hypothetical protein